VFLLVT